MVEGTVVTEQEKAENEISAFHEFLQKAALPIDPLSVCKRNPPEPDISCFHALEGEIAFEMTEICDHNIAKALSIANTESLWASDPTSRILKKKGSRLYDSSSVQLLLYTNGRVATPDYLIISNIKRNLKKLKGKFRRIWFMGRREVHLICDFISL